MCICTKERKIDGWETSGGKNPLDFDFDYFFFLSLSLSLSPFFFFFLEPQKQEKKSLTPFFASFFFFFSFFISVCLVSSDLFLLASGEGKKKIVHEPHPNQSVTFSCLE